MARRMHVRGFLWWPALLGVVGLVVLGCAKAAESTNPWTSWHSLRLKVRAMPLFTGRVEMQLDRDGGQWRLATTSTARFLGAKLAQSRTLSVFDVDSGHTRLYEEVTKKRGKRFVFGKAGYRVDKLRPSGNADEPLDRWQVVSSEEYAYPTDEDGRRVDVFDYYGMLFYLRRLGLDHDGDEATVHVATSKGPTAYRVIVGETERLEVEVTDPGTGEPRTLDARAQRLRLVPGDPDQDDAGFLKMEGETELWVEAESKTLLHLSGKVPKVPGRVRLVLSEMG